MTAASAHAIHVTDYDIAIGPAIAAAVTYKPHHFAKDRVYDPSESSLALAIIIEINKNLESVKHDFLRLTPSAARIVVNGIKADYELAKNSAHTIITYYQENAGTDDLLKELHTLAVLMLEIFDNLETAMDDTEVDETSDSYASFLTSMVNEKNTESPVSGRKALFAIFED